MALAGRLANLVENVAASKAGQRVLSKGGKELLTSSVPGALLTGILSGLTTGNPLAGLAVGASDLALSFGLSRALGSTNRFAGKYRNYASEDDIAKYTGVSNIPASVLKKEYVPSMAQHAAMLAGSTAAVSTLEPMFLRMQQEQAMNQMVTQQQQLGQQEELNNMYQPYTADGTLYQLQGLPYRVTAGA